MSQKMVLFFCYESYYDYDIRNESSYDDIVGMIIL
jgi:hypothetical protein